MWINPPLFVWLALLRGARRIESGDEKKSDAASQTTSQTIRFPSGPDSLQATHRVMKYMKRSPRRVGSRTRRIPAYLADVEKDSSLLEQVVQGKVSERVIGMSRMRKVTLGPYVIVRM